jgi:hypothetical protein
MSATSTRKHETTAGAAPAAVVNWRTERLIGAGLTAALARPIAADCGYDLHALLSLVDSGCPPELAARILAPFKETSRLC